MMKATSARASTPTTTVAPRSTTTGASARRNAGAPLISTAGQKTRRANTASRSAPTSASSSAARGFVWIDLRQKASGAGAMLRRRRNRNRGVLLQWLDLDDRGAVVAADPKRAGLLGVIDVDAADVGRAREMVFGVLPAL